MPRKVIEEAEEMGEHGIAFGAPAHRSARSCAAGRQSVVKKLTGGLRVLAKQRKVEVVQGTGRFVSPNVLEVMGSSGSQRIRFDQCIIAAGSEAIRLPGLPDDPRIMDSTDALELPEFSGGCWSSAAASSDSRWRACTTRSAAEVSVVELTPQLMPGCDPDLVRPLERRIRARYEQILLGTKVAKVEALKARPARDASKATRRRPPQVFERVLVAVGRVPNGKTIGAEPPASRCPSAASFRSTSRCAPTCRTSSRSATSRRTPMLAHKAMHEAKVAAEVAAGQKRAFDARVDSVGGLHRSRDRLGRAHRDRGEGEGIAFKKGAFPWVANGRSLSLGREEGFTKLLFDPETHRVLGGGIVGTNAGELISEVALAIENGCDAADIGLTIHPHPTLSETVAGAAEAFEGTLTDLYIPKK